MFNACLGFIPYSYSVRAVTDEFPIGLVLNYEVTEDDSTWTERYEVVRWAIEVGENILEIDLITTDTGAIRDQLLVNTQTWNCVNADGTPRTEVVSPPLWLDTSNWTVGIPIFIPTSVRHYHLLNGVPSGVQAGSFLSWEASYYWSTLGISSTWRTTREKFYFEEGSGILLEWSYSFTQHYSSSWSEDTKSKTLTSANLRAFGVLTIPERVFPGVLLGFLIIISVIMVCYAVWGRRSSSPHEGSDIPLAEEESTLELSTSLEGEEAGSAATAERGDDVVGSKCMVCRHLIKARSSYLRCPRCKGVAHRSHMLEWLKVNGRCPICRKKLRPSDL